MNTKHTTAEFYEMVRSMRDTQIQYFNTRDRRLLIRAKLLEGNVDQMLDEYFGSLPQNYHSFSYAIYQPERIYTIIFQC